jgi:lipopolysaccharide transport system permease protein
MEFEIKAHDKFKIGLKELWEYRELFFFFTWRDVKIKYKQTVLGFLWAILQPLFMTVVFTLFLGESISQKSHLPIPYPVFALSGMLLWSVFSGGMSNAANSMVTNANIIKKIYFPRLIIPISSILVALVDFFIALIVFVVVLFFYKVDINYTSLLLLPLSLFIACLSAMGIGLLLAALNIKYRDVRYVIPFLVQGLLFLTPVLYPANISSNSVVLFVLKLNPLSGALELMRGIFVGYTISLETIVYSLSSSIVLFLIGIIYFRKTEGYFADLA